MRLELIADLHLFSENEISCSLTPRNHNQYLLGDIVDMANVSAKDLETAKAVLYKLMADFGPNFIPGNHERLTAINETRIIQTENGKIILAHGDFESWGEDKAMAYRRRPWGAKWFKRNILVRAIDDYEHHFKRNFSIDFRNRAGALALRNGCGTYICGHLHPKEMIDIVHNGIRLIVLKRGKTVLDL